MLTLENTSLTKENKIDKSSSLGDAIQTEPPFVFLTQEDKTRLCSQYAQTSNLGLGLKSCWHISVYLIDPLFCARFEKYSCHYQYHYN